MVIKSLNYLLTDLNVFPESIHDLVSKVVFLMQLKTTASIYLHADLIHHGVHRFAASFKPRAFDFSATIA